jgi:hypothetical protein
MFNCILRVTYQLRVWTIRWCESYSVLGSGRPRSAEVTVRVSPRCLKIGIVERTKG